jgi:hypothetical protein
VAPRAFLCVVVVLTACVDGTGAGPYAMATDPGSRYGFRYVRDRGSGLWVHRECEARVSTKRPLPDPLSDDEQGDRLHSQRFEPETVETGGLVPTDLEVRDGWRVWRFRHLPSEADLRGRSAFGIQIEHPRPGEPSEWEPMELFAFPPMATMVPDVWSDWTSAPSQRAGAFGWWEEVHGSAPEPPQPIAFPFELRCRLLLKDHLYVD